MEKLLTSSFTLFYVFMTLSAFSQVSEITQYKDTVFFQNIMTVQLYQNDLEMSDPVLVLNGEHQLNLLFDELGHELKEYYYTIELCDVQWRKAPMQQIEYLNGFYELPVKDYSFSNATRTEFIHYSVKLPGEEMIPTKSGNYCLKVYLKDGNSNKIAFTRRMYVSDASANVKINISVPQSIELKQTSQQVNFVLDTQENRIVNPYKNLTVIIRQNRRTDNQISTLKPRYIRDNIMDFNFDTGNVFEGNNEFRSFDIRSMYFRPAEIQDVVKVSGVYHVYLNADVRRNSLTYSYKSDLNGRFFIKNTEGNDSYRDADYVYVHFQLKYDPPRIDGNMYVNGALTNWQLADDGKMKYNARKRAYECILFLKQGYYEYQYVFVPNGSDIAIASDVEGTFFPTENEYSVFVYYRQPGDLYDRLITTQSISTKNQF